jgi:hypothetical protein
MNRDITITKIMNTEANVGLGASIARQFAARGD